MLYCIVFCSHIMSLCLLCFSLCSRVFTSGTPTLWSHCSRSAWEPSREEWDRWRSPLLSVDSIFPNTIITCSLSGGGNSSLYVDWGLAWTSTLWHAAQTALQSWRGPEQMPRPHLLTPCDGEHQWHFSELPQGERLRPPIQDSRSLFYWSRPKAHDHSSV